MNQPALATSAPAPFLRRAFDWWIAQVKHALPPTIFFFVGFNLILWTKRLILEEHGVEFGGFLTATLAALLVGKAVLVTDNLPFMRRFDGAPLIQPILFKSTIYWAPRKIAAPCRVPQNCLRMIPFRSRSNSLTFTPGLSAIGNESNFSRCPIGYVYLWCG